ncbi:MAG TPA: hypothetical protein VJT73_10355, partial [Polyangiaceae bacterium]|nr:hypothetical protein [Polyangiaceae bacterium]
MSDQDRTLALAREIWKSARPGPAEVRRGADRLGRRLRLRRQPLLRRKTWTLMGSFAVFFGALVYAKNGEVGGPIDAQRDAKHLLPMNGPGPALVPTEPESSPSDRDTNLGASSNAATQRRAARWVPSEVTPPSEPSAISPPAPVETTIEKTREVSPQATRAAKRPLAVVKPAGNEASWIEISDALTAGDQKGAEKLLSNLSAGADDADTRAKAKLGLAQLEASRGHCANARTLALQASVVPDIEPKTMR